MRTNIRIPMRTLLATIALFCSRRRSAPSSSPPPSARRQRAARWSSTPPRPRQRRVSAARNTSRGSKAGRARATASPPPSPSPSPGPIARCSSTSRPRRPTTKSTSTVSRWPITPTAATPPSSTSRVPSTKGATRSRWCSPTPRPSLRSRAGARSPRRPPSVRRGS